jgi:hypothetical protein
MQAITSSYNGMGGNRVSLDYDNFVTAFSYPDIELFASGESLPRLSQLSSEQASRMLADVDSMAMHTSTPSSGVNWQDVTDSIIGRFGPRLKYLKAGNFAHADSLHNQTILVIEPYVDWDHRNSTLELERCARHYIPETYRLPLAGQAILQVSRKICSTLLAASEPGIDDTTVMKMLDDLVNYLAWTSWKQCTPGCEDDEICWTAIWPFGEPHDIERPLCVNATGIGDRWGYWEPMPEAHSF